MRGFDSQAVSASVIGLQDLPSFTFYFSVPAVIVLRLSYCSVTVSHTPTGFADSLYLVYSLTLVPSDELRSLGTEILETLALVGTLGCHKVSLAKIISWSWLHSCLTHFL